MIRWRWIGVAAGVAAADQLTKWIAATQLAGGRVVPVMEPLLTLRLVHNRGIAFGLFSSLIVPLTILAVITILTFTRWVGRDLGFRGAGGVAMGLVLGGAIGNLIDRVRLGSVVDFIDLWRWPTFNGADICIVSGCVILAVIYGRRRPEGQTVPDRV